MGVTSTQRIPWTRDWNPRTTTAKHPTFRLADKDGRSVNSIFYIAQSFLKSLPDLVSSAELKLLFNRELHTTTLYPPSSLRGSTPFPYNRPAQAQLPLLSKFLTKLVFLFYYGDTLVVKIRTSWHWYPPQHCRAPPSGPSHGSPAIATHCGVGGDTRGFAAARTKREGTKIESLMVRYDSMKRGSKKIQEAANPYHPAGWYSNVWRTVDGGRVSHLYALVLFVSRVHISVPETRLGLAMG